MSEQGDVMWSCQTFRTALVATLLCLCLPALGQTPTVARVVPAFGPASGSNIVIVSGSGFAAGAAVTFGGFAATSVAISNSTTLTAHPPAHVSGSVIVSVTNPGGLPGSKANGYKYLAPSGTFGIQFFAVTQGAVTDITAGPDGNLWLLNNGGEDLVPWSISKMTPSGAFTNYPLPDSGLLTDIAPGPDGNLWYTRMREGFTSSGAAVGRITPPASRPSSRSTRSAIPGESPRARTAPYGSAKATTRSPGGSRPAARSRSTPSTPARTGSRSGRTAHCGWRDASNTGLDCAYCPAGSFRASRVPTPSSASPRRRSSPAPTATSGSCIRNE